MLNIYIYIYIYIYIRSILSLSLCSFPPIIINSTRERGRERFVIIGVNVFQVEKIRYIYVCVCD